MIHKKKCGLSLLVISLMFFNMTCFARLPLDNFPLPAPKDPIEFAIYLGQAVMAVVFFGWVGIDGYYKYKNRDTEKIIKPGETILLRSKFVFTNKTDKPIIYDTQSGKIFETVRFPEGDFIKGKEREVETKFNW